MTNITKAQRELLTLAAATPEGMIDAGDDAKFVNRLIKQGLAVALHKKGEISRLTITEAGRKAVAPPTMGVGAQQSAAGRAEDGGVETNGAPPSDGPKGRLGKLVVLLKRTEGATLDEMTAATGWQAHSVRGALAGSLKKRNGLTIESYKRDGVRRYRIAQGGEA